MNTTFARATLVAALIAGASSAAVAQSTGSAPAYNCGVSATAPGTGTTCINGGGSTLAQHIYTGTVAAQGFDGEMTQFAAAAGGSVGFYYEGAGSGAGQSAFADNDPNQWGNGDAVSAFTVHFGASDAYVVPTTASAGTSDLSQYIYPAKLPTGGAFIQIPFVATPITIPTGVNAAVTNDGQVSLYDADLCGIFSGKITNWNQTAQAKNKLTGQVHVFWRADNGGSGTTFLLTQHLAAVCTKTNVASTATFKGFVATTKFAQLFVGGALITPGSSTSLWQIPTTGLTYGFGVKGSGGVAAGLNGDAQGIGYLSPDFTHIASVNASNASYNKLFTAQLLNKNDQTFYAPSVVAVNTAINNAGAAANLNPPTSKTTAQVQTNWVPAITTPLKGYPIVGYTNLVLATCYKDAKVTSNLLSFLTKHINGSYTSTIQSNGFVPTIGGAASGYGNAINKVFLTNISGYNLNIGNTTACKGVVGR